jgi:hypothetical protein
VTVAVIAVKAVVVMPVVAEEGVIANV